MTEVLWLSLKSGSLIPLALFFLKIALAIQDLLCLQFLKLFVLALSVKNAIGILIGI